MEPLNELQKIVKCSLKILSKIRVPVNLGLFEVLAASHPIPGFQKTTPAKGRALKGVAWIVERIHLIGRAIALDIFSIFIRMLKKGDRRLHSGRPAARQQVSGRVWPTRTSNVISLGSTAGADIGGDFQRLPG